MSVVPCFVYLYPNAARDPAAPDGAGYCARDGRFGPGAGPLLQAAGFGTKSPSTYDTSYVVVLGIESAASFPVKYTGPLGSRIYSPLTSLIESAGGQAAVKSAFGLDGGVFSLATDRDLTTFDPADALASSDDSLHREGARIAAANLRATATAAALMTVPSGTAPGPYRLGFLDVNYTQLGTIIAANSNFLFDNARMTQILTTLAPAGRYRPDVLSAAAHLIDAYAAAIGVQIADSASAAQFTLGIAGYLEPELAALLAANTADAANAALATTTATILDRTAIFRETVPFPSTGLYFPSPDFFSGASGTPITVRWRWTGMTTILDNDLYANGPEAAIGFFSSPASSEVLSVTVPPANASKITATLSADTITVNSVAAFKGTSYFDYRVRHPSGTEGIARIYVTFR